MGRPVTLLVWLAGFLLLPFRAQHEVLPIAAWLAPVFLLRVSRTARRFGIAFCVLVVSYALADSWALRGGYLYLPMAAIAGVALMAGIAWSIPYALDRALARRLSPIAATLVFPAATVAVEALYTRFGILGSWGSPGYSQAGNLPLVQIVSITGLTGITFLIHWLAPVVNAAWEKGFELRAVRGPAIAFTVVIVAVLLFGSIRLVLFPPKEETVRVAALASDQRLYDGAYSGLVARRIGPASPAERAAFRPQFAANSDDLFLRSEAVAAVGAKIVAWQEGVPVLEEDLPAFFARAATIAREHGIYLEVTPWVVRKSDRFPWVENSSALFGPDGKQIWRYFKTHPVPGMEDNKFGNGPGKLPITDTPYGRIAAAICFDMDFPALARQAGRQGVDLLIVSSDDWKPITTTHAAMHPYRGIENGASMLRPTSGISLVTDYQGRILGAVNFFATDHPTLVTAVPRHGVRTFYAWAGEWFSWACLALVVGLALVARRAGVRS